MAGGVAAHLLNGVAREVDGDEHLQIAQASRHELDLIVRRCDRLHVLERLPLERQLCELIVPHVDRDKLSEPLNGRMDAAATRARTLDRRAPSGDVYGRAALRMLRAS